MVWWCEHNNIIPVVVWVMVWAIKKGGRGGRHLRVLEAVGPLALAIVGKPFLQDLVEVASVVHRGLVGHVQCQRLFI